MIIKKIIKKLPPVLVSVLPLGVISFCICLAIHTSYAWRGGNTFFSK